MKQPLNKAYQNEILEAYQKISDTFNDFTQLMRRRVPYESWPKHCQILCVNPDLLGCDPPETKIECCDDLKKLDPLPIPESFYDQMLDISKITAEQMEECIQEGWKHVQSYCRPDESFRAMLQVMIRWMAYMEAQKEKEEYKNNIWDILKANDLDPTKAFPMAMMSRIEDIGRVQERIKSILDDNIFDILIGHDPYWDSKYEIEAKKLDDLRIKFSCLEDNLLEIMGILKTEKE